MDETSQRGRWLDRRLWLLSFGFWLFVASAQVLPYVVLDSGYGREFVLLQLRGSLLFVPFVPGTVILWRLSGLWHVAGTAVARKSMLLVLGLTLVHIMWSRWLGFGIGPKGVRLLSSMVTHGINYCGVLAVALAFHSHAAFSRRSAELNEARLRLLRAQLQPHFLFNTLQAIGATAPRDGAAAAHMTALLGDLLRQTLQERDGGFVSLAEENELLRPYVELQQLRFGDRLRFELDLPSDLLGARIPDLLLQPLVENALQHGIEQRPGAGRVRVSARREGEQLVLDVADDGAGPGSDCQEPKSGTGLGATRSRLQTLFGARASLALQRNGLGGCTATLRLPYDEAAHAA